MSRKKDPHRTKVFFGPFWVGSKILDIWVKTSYSGGQRLFWGRVLSLFIGCPSDYKEVWAKECFSEEKRIWSIPPWLTLLPKWLKPCAVWLRGVYCNIHPWFACLHPIIIQCPCAYSWLWQIWPPVKFCAINCVSILIVFSFYLKFHLWLNHLSKVVSSGTQSPPKKHLFSNCIFLALHNDLIFSYWPV